MKTAAKLKCIDSQTPPEDIIDTFHNRNLASSEWEKYADHLLKRGVQRVADEIRENPQQISEKNTHSNHHKDSRMSRVPTSRVSDEVPGKRKTRNRNALPTR